MISGISTAISRAVRSGKPEPARRAAIAGSIIAPARPDPARAAGSVMPRASSTALPRTGPCIVRW